MNPISNSSSQFPSISSSSSSEIELLQTTELDNGQAWIDLLKKSYIEPSRKKLYDLVKGEKNQSVISLQIDRIRSLDANVETLYSHLKSQRWTSGDLVDMSKAIYRIKNAFAMLGYSFSDLDTDRAVKILQSVEFEKPIVHLDHLIGKRLSDLHNPRNDCFFYLPIEQAQLYFVNDRGQWKMLQVVHNNKTLHALSWGFNIKDHFSYAILLKSGTPVTAPFIAIQFSANTKNPLIGVAIKGQTSLSIPPNQLEYMAKVYYCSHFPEPGSSGNTIQFMGTFGPGTENVLKGNSADLFYTESYRYANQAIHLLKDRFLENFIKRPWEQSMVTEAIILPTTRQEEQEKLLDVLELAVEENDMPLIEYIVEKLDEEFTEQELIEAPSPFIVLSDENGTSPSPSAAMEKEVPVIVLAKASLSRRAKRALLPSKEEEKKVPFKPASKSKAPPNSSSSSRSFFSSSSAPSLSKEELIAKMSSLDMDPKLKSQAVDLLDGNRLASKREETRFFSNILRYQAMVNGCGLKKAKRGSHESVVLKNTGTKYAVTLVDRHGRDKNRGHSLSVQQNKLLEIFTPKQ